MKFEQTHWLHVPINDVKVMVKSGCVYAENGAIIGSYDDLKSQGLERLTVDTRTVFLARHRDGTYFTECYSSGPIDEAMIFLTKEVADFELKPRVTFEVIEFKLVECEVL